jgi:hypothetical protein
MPIPSRKAIVSRHARKLDPHQVDAHVIRLSPAHFCWLIMNASCWVVSDPSCATIWLYGLPPSADRGSHGSGRLKCALIGAVGWAGAVCADSEPISSWL